MDLPDPRADGQRIPRILAEEHQQYQPEFRVLERPEEASVRLPQSGDLGHAGRVRELDSVCACMFGGCTCTLGNITAGNQRKGEELVR